MVVEEIVFYGGIVAECVKTRLSKKGQFVRGCVATNAIWPGLRGGSQLTVDPFKFSGGVTLQHVSNKG